MFAFHTSNNHLVYQQRNAAEMLKQPFLRTIFSCLCLITLVKFIPLLYMTEH